MSKKFIHADAIRCLLAPDKPSAVEYLYSAPFSPVGVAIDEDFMPFSELIDLCGEFACDAFDLSYAGPHGCDLYLSPCFSASGSLVGFTVSEFADKGGAA